MGSFGDHFSLCAKMAQQGMSRKKNHRLLIQDDASDLNQEAERKKQLRLDLKRAVEQLIVEVDKRRVECDTKIDQLGQRRSNLVEEKARLYATSDQDKKQMSDLEVEIAAKQQSLNLILQSVSSIGSQIAELKRKIDNARAKKRQLETWWWVPGYGIYLAIDSMIDEDLQHINSLQNDYNRKNDEINSLRDELDDLNKQISERKEDVSDLGARICAVEKDLGDCIGSINNTNRDLLQWMELRSYYGSIEAVLESDDCDPDEIAAKLANLGNELKMIA